MARLTPALYGALSAVLFIIVYGYGFGLPLLMLAPTVPLLMIGLKRGVQPMIPALGAGALIALLGAGAGGVLFFIGIIGIPALLFAASVYRRHTAAALSEAALYGTAAIAGLMAHFADAGGLEQLLAKALLQGAEGAEPTVQAAMERVAGAYGFALLGGSVYFWVLLLYVHALLARKLAKAPALPPLAPFPLSPRLLGALAAAAIISLLGEQWAFAGKTLFILLLCPYFLLGLGWAHARLQAHPARLPLLIALYLLLFIQGWPALVFACIGLWQQVKGLSLNKKA